ncbi:hypothetical protein B0F90DRAFT_1761324 [Multifurca ochricompacta]|uniref:Uncharacterized protein n=1 Tax=Multifurca ochricompacta TaxID=376703 RepID=A0AAD4LZ67_9AGAM|nr:hypothetical protein B0F90DRAFT_1761324 [Multifurca ochricompacta]
MSQIHQEAINLGDTPGEGIGTDDHLYPPQPAPNRVQQEESNYVDGSGPLFSMYVEMTGEEDKKLAESWKADADGILVFTVDWFVLGRRRSFVSSLSPGHSTEPTGHLRILSRKYLSAPCQCQWFSYLHSIYPLQPILLLFSPKLGCLG